MADWIRDLQVGQWYDMGQGPVEVIGIDVDNEVILVQHFDGELEEFDFDSWMELRAVPIAAPEDWRGAMGCTDEEVDDSVNDVPRVGRWDGPLEHLDQIDPSWLEP